VGATAAAPGKKEGGGDVRQGFIRSLLEEGQDVE